MAFGDGTVIRYFLVGPILSAFALIACSQENAMILELKDVQFFQAQQTNSTPLTIKVSGLAFHSSLAVQEITTSKDNGSMQILVHLVPAKDGRSGNFDYSIVIPAEVNNVTFGGKKVVIWSRSTGIVSSPQ